MFTFTIFSINITGNSESQNKKPKLCINEKSINGFIADFENLLSNIENFEISSAKDSFHQFTTIFKELYDKWFLHIKPSNCKNVHMKSEWITQALAKSS